MGQIFHPSWNVLARVMVFGAPVLLALVGIIAYSSERSPNTTNVGISRTQPVPFSHKHHVDQLGIDCRFCHQSVETAAFAGMPSTGTCMKCHSQVWPRESMLAPVRESYDTGEPIHWLRLHDLPDHAFFNHSIHIQKGVGCSTCHGQVDQMPLTATAQRMHMQWCLDCHREPEKFVRERDQVFNMKWQPSADQTQRGKKLLERFNIAPTGLTNCSVCHR